MTERVAVYRPDQLQVPEFDDLGDPVNFPLAIVAACVADDEGVQTVLAAPTDGIDGRSPWMFYRLANGDLIFGCFPQGDTYFATETSHP